MVVGVQEVVVASGMQDWVAFSTQECGLRRRSLCARSVKSLACAATASRATTSAGLLTFSNEEYHVESYRTEEEQVEALRRWWEENGRSTIVAIVVALAAGFGWQAWKGYNQDNIEGASNIYQSLLQSINS